MRTSPHYHGESVEREQAIRAAFNFDNDRAPYAICDANYWLFGDLKENIPLDYCSEDPSSMIDYQLSKIEKHMSAYDDIYIPFLMPWYGTGVLASAFHLDVVFQDYMDPAVDLSKIKDVQQLKDMSMPDPEKDGLMPRVLNTIRQMREKTDMPVAITDCQGTLTTALQVVGYDNFIYWMYDHPDKIHDFMQLVTDALIAWVKIQKQVAGQDTEDDAYVLGIKIPTGFGGVWVADDDSILLNKELYKEFVVPYNSQLLKAFGGGSIHYCGNSNQNIENYLETEGLTAIHNLNIDDLDGAAKMRDALAEKNIPFIVGDFNVQDDYIDEYYKCLFEKLGTKGLIVAPYIAPAIMLKGGKYVEARSDPDKIGRLIEKAILKYNRPQNSVSANADMVK